jgi:hypothetical protein
VDAGRDVWLGFQKNPEVSLRKRAHEGLRWVGPKEFLRSAVLDAWTGGATEDHESILGNEVYPKGV